MNQLLNSNTCKSAGVFVFSLEPLWIDYGMFPRLPATGEDIFCDSVNFHYGRGYELVRALTKDGLPANWFLHYSEPAFQALVQQQAVRDGIQDCIYSTEQITKTSLAVTAPQQCGEKKYILVNPPKEMDTDQLMAVIPDNSWLVLCDWEQDHNLQKMLGNCQQHNIKVFLGIPIHERIPFSWSYLIKLSIQYPIIETLFLYVPAYLPELDMSIASDQLEKLKVQIPLIIQEDKQNIHFLYEKKIQSHRKKINGNSCTLNNFLAAYLQARFTGSTIPEAFAYAQDARNTQTTPVTRRMQ